MFTPEQQEALTSLITNAMSAQLNTFRTEFKTELMAEVNTRNSGLAASVNRDVKKQLEAFSAPQGNEAANAADTNATPNGTSGSDSSSNTGRLTMASLSKENADLKAKFEALEKKAAQKSLNATLSDLCASNKVRPEAFAAVRDAFLFRNQSKLKSEESPNDPDALNWFLSLSENEAVPLNKAFSEYLATDEGKLFVAHSPAPGSGMKEQPKQLSFASGVSQASTNGQSNNAFRAIASQLVSE